jgi:ABC-type transporter Mla maintaining outer membrane lipid asymmetry ATPase subunit MlaF
MLYRGRIIAIGAAEEFRQSPNPAVQQLLTGSTRGPLTEAYLQGTSES